MLIIGELINGMYSKVREAISRKDASVISDIALKQINSGADALDLNCGPLSKNQIGDLCWLVEVVQNVTDKPLCLDSTKIEAIKEALGISKNKTIINSSNAEEEKLKIFIPLAKKHNSSLIALAMDKKGIPQNKDQRIELAAKIIGCAQDENFDLENLYLDPVLMPVNVAQNQINDILESIRDLKLLSEPKVKTIVGLSNVSQGARFRPLLNRIFAVMAISVGLDAAILDPLDKDLNDSIIASELFLNKHIYCDSFLEAYKKTN